MKTRANTRLPAARRARAVLSSPISRLSFFACAAFGAGFVLSAAQVGGKCLPLAISLVAALPFSLSAIFCYAGAACGYLFYWGAGRALEPVAAGFLSLSASCLFYDVVPREKRWFMPLCAGGVYAGAALIFLLSASVTASSLAVYLARVACAVIFTKLFSGAAERKRESLAALGLCLLASAGHISLMPGFPASFVLAGCAVFLLSGTDFYALCAAACGIALELSCKPDFFATAMLTLAAFACHHVRPRAVFLRAAVYFSSLAISSFFFGAGRSMFPFGAFCGTILGAIFFQPAQKYLPQRQALDEKHRASLNAASGALWSLAASLQRGSTCALEPQSAAIFDKAAEEVCRTCAKWSVCWEENAQETFRLLSRAARGILRRGEAKRDDLPPLFLARCCHTESFLRAVSDALTQQLAKVQYQSRLAENRQILCDQYRSLSRLLQTLGEEIPEPATPDAYTPELGFRARGLRGGKICGDFGASFRLGEWYYVLLCDGMGSGEQARNIALETSKLLEELLRAGLDAQDAMQSINALFILRDSGAFAAIDLLQLSLLTGEGFLHKWGAAPSFLKFGRTVQRLGSPLPPPGLGVGQGYRPECIRVSMQRGEALILTSDGVDAALAEGYLRSCGELPVRELAAGVVASSDDAPPDDRTAAAVRLRLCQRPVRAQSMLFKMHLL